MYIQFGGNILNLNNVDYFSKHEDNPSYIQAYRCVLGNRIIICSEEFNTKEQMYKRFEILSDILCRESLEMMQKR